MVEAMRDILAVLGGVGIIILGLSKFFGGIVGERLKERSRKKSEIDIETHRQRLASRRVQTDQFAQSQYDIYVDIWRSLQGIKLAVDSLWEKANSQNIASLARCLRETRSRVDNWSFFFDEEHFKRLNELLVVLERFKEGKTFLVNIWSSQDVTIYFKEGIDRQIEKNRNYKEKFESLLSEIKTSFRNRLSQVKYED